MKELITGFTMICFVIWLLAGTPDGLDRINASLDGVTIQEYSYYQTPNLGQMIDAMGACYGKKKREETE